MAPLGANDVHDKQVYQAVSPNDAMYALDKLVFLKMIIFNVHVVSI